MQQNMSKEFFKYTLLNILGMTGLSCYILADTFFVSKRLGADGLTSLNLAISVYSIINGFGLMLGIGGATRYSICTAQKDHRRGNQYFTVSVLAGLALGCLLLLTGVTAADGIAGLLGAEGSIRGMTGTYLRTILVFAPFFLLNNIMTAFVRNDNNPSLAMAAMLTGSFSNILLDYVFLFPCGMGIFGAALATGMAPLISLCLLSLHFLRKKNHFSLCIPHRKTYRETQKIIRMIRDLCLLGASAFVNELSSAIVLIVFNLLILHLAGNTGVAAYGIVANLALVALAIFTGISQGCQPLISRCHGKGDHTVSRNIFHWAAALAAGTGIACSIASILFTDGLVQIFNSENNAQLAAIAHRGLPLYFLGFCPAGVNVIAASFLGAVESGKKAFVLSFSRGIAAILFFAFLLSALWEMNGIWLAFPAAETFTLILTFVLLRRQK